MTNLPAIRAAVRPARYETGADPESRAKILAAVETFPESQRLAAACMFTLVALRGMRSAAPGPAQRKMCQEHIDILLPLIPAEVRSMFPADVQDDA